MRYMSNLVGGIADGVYSDSMLCLFPSLKAWLTGIHIRESGISVGSPVIVKIYGRDERRGEFRARCGDAIDVEYRQSGGDVERHLLADLNVIESCAPVATPVGGIIDIED